MWVLTVPNESGKTKKQHSQSQGRRSCECA
ncbi:protein of unknown function (plasmid) [Azospirillum baldaniorum]|uniref:Uncharacterized protein n=1 Tax=Azospirillum baldaniorum TaxID=1064539 RepID=A0A9P1NP65_9PROT|nr:protein of unknown function [Azospirillum baldaniorum]